MPEKPSAAGPLNFFAPYAQYTLCTRLDGETLRTGLNRECDSSFACWKRWFLASMNGDALDPVPLSLERAGQKIVLLPWCWGKNSLRGRIRITVEERGAEGALLHVVIAPADLRWFLVLLFGFLVLFTVMALLARLWILLVPPAFFTAFAYWILRRSRRMAEREIPRIKSALEALLRRLEKQERDGVGKDGDVSQRSFAAGPLDFFAPYAEYTLSTRLDEEALRAGLKRECGSVFACWKRWFAAAMNSGDAPDPIPLSLKRSGVCLGWLRERKIVLHPWCGRRNSLQGLIRITVEERGAEGALLHVVIAPSDLRWFLVLWFGFLAFFAVAATLAGKWLALAPCVFMGAAACLILRLCRKMGEREIPRIQTALEALLRKLEKQAEA